MFKKAWTQVGHLFIVGAFVLLVLIVGNGGIGGSLEARWLWLIGLMVVFLIVVGLTTNGRMDGVLIDWRNKVSLSRLQVAIWTVLGMSAFLVIGLTRTKLVEQGKIGQLTPANAGDFARMVGGVECLEGIDELTESVLEKCPAGESLQVIFPEELILAMGISIASFAGSALVKRNKGNLDVSAQLGPSKMKEISGKIQAAQSEEQDAAKKIQDLDTKETTLKARLDAVRVSDQADLIAVAQTAVDGVKDQAAELRSTSNAARQRRELLEKEFEKLKEEEDRFRGAVHTNAKPGDAKWSDMFAEEGMSYDRVDLAKVQMFFVTIAVIFAYGTAVSLLLRTADVLANPFGVALPAFSATLVVLLGVSHGGYLTMKATGG